MKRPPIKVALPILAVVVLIVVLVVTGRIIPMSSSDDHPLLIVIYTDFQCGPCGRLHSEVEPELRERYVATGKAQIEIRLLGVMSPDSMRAAEAALCAGDQGRVLAYKVALFEAYSADEDPTVFSMEALTQLAVDLGLDEAAFACCLNGGAKGAEIEENMTMARDDRVSTLPALLVGDVIIQGRRPLDTYIQAIEKALSTPPA